MPDETNSTVCYPSSRHPIGIGRETIEETQVTTKMKWLRDTESEQLSNSNKQTNKRSCTSVCLVHCGRDIVQHRATKQPRVVTAIL